MHVCGKSRGERQNMAGKILIVEDDADTRDALTQLFGLEDFQIVTAEDGQSGLEKADKEHPDLIVTDIMMPKLDGIEMIKRLRAQAQYKLLPIIALSGYNDKVLEAVRAGANSSMLKPVTVSLLIKAVKRMI
jgi:CheY-like chemotaxis protein